METWEKVIGAFVLAFVVWFLYMLTLSDWAARNAEMRALQEKANATPHVVREADGCKVYAFKSGDRYHYFTRCDTGQVSTETTYQECHQSGKVRTCTEKSDVIETKQGGF